METSSRLIHILWPARKQHSIPTISKYPDLPDINTYSTVSFTPNLEKMGINSSRVRTPSNITNRSRAPLANNGISPSESPPTYDDVLDEEAELDIPRRQAEIRHEVAKIPIRKKRMGDPKLLLTASVEETRAWIVKALEDYKGTTPEVRERFAQMWENPGKDLYHILWKEFYKSLILTFVFEDNFMVGHLIHVFDQIAKRPVIIMGSTVIYSRGEHLKSPSPQ